VPVEEYCIFTQYGEKRKDLLITIWAIGEKKEGYQQCAENQHTGMPKTTDWNSK